MEIRTNKTDKVKVGNRLELISDLDIHTIDLIQEEHKDRILRSSGRVRAQETKTAKIKAQYLIIKELLLDNELELAKEKSTNNFLKVISSKLRVKKESLKSNSDGRTVSQV